MKPLIHRLRPNVRPMLLFFVLLILHNSYCSMRSSVKCKDRLVELALSCRAGRLKREVYRHFTGLGRNSKEHGAPITLASELVRVATKNKNKFYGRRGLPKRIISEYVGVGSRRRFRPYRHATIKALGARDSVRDMLGFVLKEEEANDILGIATGKTRRRTTEKRRESIKKFIDNCCPNMECVLRFPELKECLQMKHTLL